MLNHKNKDSCKQETTTIAGLEREIIEMKQMIAGLEGEISELKPDGGNTGDIVGGTECTSNSVPGFCGGDGVLGYMVNDGLEFWGYKLTQHIHNKDQETAYPRWRLVGSQPFNITLQHSVMSTTLLRHDINQPVFNTGEGHGGLLFSMVKSSEQWQMMAVSRACYYDHCMDKLDFSAPGTCTAAQVKLPVSGCSDRMIGQLKEDPWQRWSKDRDGAVNQQKNVYKNTWNEFNAMAVSPRDVIGLFYPRGIDKPPYNTAWDNSNPATWALNACAKLKEMANKNLYSPKSEWPIYEYTLKGGGSTAWDNWNPNKNKDDKADLKRVGVVNCE